jgi:hypothetical protein
MAQARLRHIGQGNTHERPFQQTWMGHAQIGFTNHLASVEKHVDIDGARGLSAPRRSNPALRPLDGEPRGEERLSGQGRLDPNRDVEVLRLVGAAFRQGLVKAAHRRHLAGLAEGGNGALDLGLAITKIRSEAKISNRIGNHVHGEYFQVADLKALFETWMGRKAPALAPWTKRW